MITSLKKEKKISRQDVLFLTFSILIFVLQIFKAHIGMGFNDEHFYTTLGQRLAMGDAMFTDDWHIAQLISVFLWPLVQGYERLHGNLDGIVLFMRICYAVFTLIVGVVLYVRFRNRGKSAVLAACCYMLFTPFSIMALSYNTMSVGFLILACCLRPEKSDPLRSYFSGVFYALAVVNTPYLAILFLVYFTYVVKNRTAEWKKFLWSFSGMLTCAVLYIMVVLSRASLSEILACLHQLVDPSHSTSILMTFVKNGARLIVDLKWMLALYVVLLVTTVMVMRHSAEKRERVFVLAAFWVIVSGVWIARRTSVWIGTYAEILCVMAGYGMLVYLLEDHKDNEVFVSFFLVSLVHAVLIASSSNVGPRSFSGPLILASCMSVLFVESYAKRSRSGLVRGSAVVSVLFFGAFLLFYKCTNIYGGLTSKEADTIIQSGPLKGLRDGSAMVADYEEHLKDVEYMNSRSQDYVLYITDNTYMYLATTHRFATNSTYPYFWDAESYIVCLKEYFSIHENKRPMQVYIDEENKYGIRVEDMDFLKPEQVKELQCGTWFIVE